MAEPSTYPAAAPLAGRAQSGRHREHVFPARPYRVAPSFTADEYAAVAAAAVRAGLTPTGFCARAALALAETPPPSGGAVIGPAVARMPGQRIGGERVEALAALQAELADTRTAMVRVGTNLNQAMAAFNATGEPPIWLRHVVEACGRVLRTVDEAASRVHRRLS